MENIDLNVKGQKYFFNIHTFLNYLYFCYLSKDGMQMKVPEIFY